MQQGPSNEGLEKIETICTQDHQDILNLKATKAKSRVKAHAVPRVKACTKGDKDRLSDEAAAAGASSMPFSISP